MSKIIIPNAPQVQPRMLTVICKTTKDGLALDDWYVESMKKIVREVMDEREKCDCECCERNNDKHRHAKSSD